MKAWWSAFAVVLMLGGSAPAWAQEPQRAPGPRGPRGDVFKMIDAYILSNLQESLDLTDEQFVKLLPLVKRLQTDRREMTQRRVRALHEMRRLLGSGAATEPRVGDLLREVKAVETEEPAVIRRDREAIDAALTPLQQAKYRILEVEVDRKLRELMSQMRGQARAPGRRRDPTPEE